MMPTPNQNVNAWILPSEDDPSGTNYNSPDSSYQNLIQYGVYQYMNQLNICFFDTVPTSSTTWPQGDGSSYTIQLGAATHPGGITNQQYMEWIIQDARAANPGIQILATLGWSVNEFSVLFPRGQSQQQWQNNCTAFANNLVAYLNNFGMNGFDIDWESSIVSSITKDQFNMLFTTIRSVFDATGKTYYLTISPAVTGNMNADTVNSSFNWVNVQIYSGFSPPSEFTGIGINQNLLAYGAKFEVNGNTPYQTAQNAYNGTRPYPGYVPGNYNVITQWRLNSNDFQYEQAQQMILYQLIYGTGNTFNDAPIAGAGGNAPVSTINIRSGNVLDSIQTVNAVTINLNSQYPAYNTAYTMVQHGGTGGDAAVVNNGNDPIVEVSGYTGIWYGWNCVLQVSFTTQSGKVYGPYGSMSGSETKTPFTFTAPAGQALVAFSGSTRQITVPGFNNTIVETLTPTFA